MREESVIIMRVLGRVPDIIRKGGKKSNPWKENGIRGVESILCTAGFIIRRGEGFPDPHKGSSCGMKGKGGEEQLHLVSWRMRTNGSPFFDRGAEYWSGRLSLNSTDGIYSSI